MKPPQTSLDNTVLTPQLRRRPPAAAAGGGTEVEIAAVESNPRWTGPKAQSLPPNLVAAARPARTPDASDPGTHDGRCRMAAMLPLAAARRGRRPANPADPAAPDLQLNLSHLSPRDQASAPPIDAIDDGTCGSRPGDRRGAAAGAGRRRDPVVLRQIQRMDPVGWRATAECL